MGYVNYTDSPKVDDTVVFELETYDAGEVKNPFLVERITIYYIERNAHENSRVIEDKSYNKELKQVQKNLVKLEKTAKVSKIYYSDARMVLRTPTPLWTNDEKIHKIVNLKVKDRVIDGKFIFMWQPKGMREGSYMIRWEWQNEENGPKFSSEKLFHLYPAADRHTSVYTKFAPREKYTFLMDKYVPDLYKIKTTPKDLTPDVLVKFNKAIAQSFLELDDLAIGLADLLDVTFVHDNFLHVIANFFNLELKSNSPSAWRSQIKHSLPLFKKKGTADAINEALDKIGIKLTKITNLWQVVSPYTWTDGFVVTKDIIDSEIIGYLSKSPVKNPEINVSIRSEEGYLPLDVATIQLQEVSVPDDRIAVIWVGKPIELFKGDVLKISYTYNKIPEDAISVEKYIANLPLADQRDEKEVKYPLKNWNVKLIEEDDPLFNLLVAEKHPFANSVVFGRIRTTFLYSEKAFNMDTYNGSLFNSTSPCDMDKDFIDTCSSGLSSKFNICIELNQVSNDTIKDIKETIMDYAPFHAILHNMKVNSKVMDITIPMERIKSDIGTKQRGETVACKDSIFCEIKYKDGKVVQGQVT